MPMPRKCNFVYFTLRKIIDKNNADGIAKSVMILTEVNEVEPYASTMHKVAYESTIDINRSYHHFIGVYLPF